MIKVYNDDIVSKITQEQYDKIEKKIDSYVCGAMEDNLSRDTCLYDVDYNSESGNVSIFEDEPIIEVDGVAVTLSAEINFEFEMVSGGGWDEPAWGEIKGYYYYGNVSLFDVDGEPIVEYDTNSDWLKY